MSRRCELTGKGPMVGNNVSHANNKTKRRFLPNLTEVSLTSETLNQTHRFRISAAALSSVDHRGGLDAFLAKAPDAELSARGAEAQARHRQGAGRRLRTRDPALDGLVRGTAGRRRRVPLRRSGGSSDSAVRPQAESADRRRSCTKLSSSYYGYDLTKL